MAAQSGGDNRNLGRAACKASCDAVRQINKEVGDASALQKRAENNKYNDILGADIYRSGKDAFLGVKQVAHEIAQSAKEFRICQAVCQCVYDENTGNNQNRQTNTAAGSLQSVRESQEYR